MAVTSAGTVYFAQSQSDNRASTTQVTLRRLAGDGSTVIVAGEAANDRFGVRLGNLPGTLHQVLGLAVAPGDALYVLSENSVLRLQPPAV